MGNQETQMANVQLCMTKLRNFVDNVPRKAGENVNWEELNQQRNLAEMSLTHLASILGGGRISSDSKINRECALYPKL